MEGRLLRISLRFGLLAAGVVLVGLLGVGPWGAFVPRARAEEIPALEARVAQLEATLEHLYLELEQAYVQAGKGAYLQAAGDLEPALSELVTAARKDAGRPAAELAAEAIEKLLRAKPTRRGTNVLAFVLGDTAEAARQDAEAKPVALLAGAAEAFFGSGNIVTIWDTRFTAHPDVQAFRRANEALAAARKRAAEPVGPRPGDAGTEEDMILLPRARGFVGPWTGWIQVLDEKQNKRQAATRKQVYIDRYEVTCAQYRAFVLAEKAHKREELLPEGWKLDEDGGVAIPEGSDRLPVTGVTFKQALAYAKHWGKRLPTESEWELCAAGVSKEGRAFPWGREAGDTAFAREGRADAPVEVDAFPEDSTPEGVIGMAGNVAEMCATLPDRSDLPRGRTPKSGDEIVVRGGSFRSSTDECSTSWRWTAEPERGHPHVGFRCVMEELDYRRRFGK